MRIGITGHRDLTAPTVELVRSEFAAQLAQSPDLTTGISCLAEGADQLFAQSVLSHGGQLDAIVPSRDDRDHMSPDGQQEFDRLPAAAFRLTRAAISGVDSGSPHGRQPPPGRAQRCTARGLGRPVGSEFRWHCRRCCVCPSAERASQNSLAAWIGSCASRGIAAVEPLRRPSTTSACTAPPVASSPGGDWLGEYPQARHCVADHQQQHRVLAEQRVAGRLEPFARSEVG